MTRDQAVEVIERSLQSVLEMEGLELEGELGAETRLMGDGAPLDSLGFVTLLLEIEGDLHDTTGAGLTLANEQALSRRHSPFRTVGTLADYVVELLQGQDSG